MLTKFAIKAVSLWSELEQSKATQCNKKTSIRRLDLMVEWNGCSRLQVLNLYFFAMKWSGERSKPDVSLSGSYLGTWGRRVGDSRKRSWGQAKCAALVTCARRHLVRSRSPCWKRQSRLTAVSFVGQGGEVFAASCPRFGLHESWKLIANEHWKTSMAGIVAFHCQIEQLLRSYL